MPGNQPRLQFAIDLKIQPRRHSLPPHPAGETYSPTRTKVESITPLQDGPNPDALAGDQGPRCGLDRVYISCKTSPLWAWNQAL
jgi:hypothetical protein